MTTQRDQDRTPGQQSPRPSIAEVLGIPFGMKRLRVGDWILAAQDDKLVLTQRSKPTRHVTLHLGESSGYFDIHLTRHRPGERTKYRTMFRIRRRLIARLFESYLRAFLATGWNPEKRARRLRPGWFQRKGWIAMHLGVAGSDKPLERLAHREKKGRARIGLFAMRRTTRIARDASELLALPEGGFVLHKGLQASDDSPIGVGVKRDRDGAPPVLWWIPWSGLMPRMEFPDRCVAKLMEHGRRRARRSS